MAKLFESFPPVSREEWKNQAIQDLKGGDYEKLLVRTTLDGLRIEAIQAREDLPPEDRLVSERRGLYRGTADWKNREQIRETDVARANIHALRALERGAQELSFLTYPMGIGLQTQADMERLLSGIHLQMVSLHWQAGPFSPHVYAMLLNEADRQGLPFDQLTGSIDLDPLTDLACGWTEGEMEDWLDVAGPLIDALVHTTPGFSLLTIRGSLIEKSGASVAQELALTLALFAEYLTGLRVAKFDLNEIVRRSELRFAVGSHYFLEIPKLRALRELLPRLLGPFDVSTRPRIHADTTSSNKTIYDPYVNLLRATTEAMSSALGGADSLTVATFDQVFDQPDEFGEHLARNTESLLREEAFLAKVADPLGGSYYAENLTDSLARVAWDLFLKIEAEGGFIGAWKSGFIASELDRVRAEKRKRIRTRRVPIVGTSLYPNLTERRSERPRKFPRQPVMSRWNENAEDLGDLRHSLHNGRRLQDWATQRPLPKTPLDPFRPAAEFESLRLRIDLMAGPKPEVLLVTTGDPAKRKARAEFCTGFFGAGGYTIRTVSLEDLPHAMGEAKVLVLCSSDEEYIGALATVLGVAGGRPVIIAGKPAQMEELRAAGASHFVYLGQDVVEFLTSLHDQLGIPSEETA